jgi:hypothetical protein
MAIWKPASVVFLGGTEQIRGLLGRRVRSRVTLQDVNVYDPSVARPQTFDVRAGAIGFVAHPHPARFDFLLAFPLDQSRLPSGLGALNRPGAFKVVEINEPTFKFQFEIECP